MKQDWGRLSTLLRVPGELFATRSQCMSRSFRFFLKITIKSAFLKICFRIIYSSSYNLALQSQRASPSQLKTTQIFQYNGLSIFSLQMFTCYHLKSITLPSFTEESGLLMVPHRPLTTAPASIFSHVFCQFTLNLFFNPKDLFYDG